MIYIYIIRNLINGKAYIGQSINPKRRCYEHFYKLKNNLHTNTHLQNSYNKYGRDCFDFTIIKECSTQEEADELEVSLIRELKIEELSLNLEDGGKRNPIVSTETRQKMKEASTGRRLSEETKEKLRQINLGKSLSVEAKDKVRQAMLGKQHALGYKNSLGYTHTSEAKYKIKQASIENWKLRSKNTYKAFGEEKSICEWCNDPRCFVNKNTLRARLKRGWSVEKAIITPASL